MQRLAITLSSFALILVIIVNIALFAQNSRLRGQLAQASSQPSLAPTSASQQNPLADLHAQLERSEQDRITATRDASAAHAQLSQLQNAAKERDTIKGQLQALQQENQQLKLEVGNLQTMNTINSQVSPLRDLPPLAHVPRTFMNHQQLRDYFTKQYDQQWSAADEQREHAILRALDMDAGNQSTDLRQAQIDSLVKNVLGFYDQNTKQLVVVTERGQMSARDKVTYAHEFTHSLQDQHYNLTALFAQTNGNSDAQLALKGLVEGDATLSMGLYARDNFSAMDIADYRLEEFKSIDASSYLSGNRGPLVESATYFPYQEGAQFVAALYQSGGWPLVDAAFAHPPRSSEQILHPQHYISGDQPVAVTLPALRLAGWHAVSEDTLGELYLRIYLEHTLPIAQALPAAAGWGGDRYQVLSNDQGDLALALETAWDGPDDAQEFFATYGAYVSALAGADANLLASDNTHMRWRLPGREFYLSRAGSQVLVLHAPDAATLDALIGQFKGF